MSRPQPKHLRIWAGGLPVDGAEVRSYGAVLPHIGQKLSLAGTFLPQDEQTTVDGAAVGICGTEATGWTLALTVAAWLETAPPALGLPQ